MSKGSLVTHRQTQHGVAKGRLGRMDRRQTGAATIQGPTRWIFRQGRGLGPAQLNIRYTMVILEEGNLPHPRCPLCDILVPWKALNGTHRSTA